MQVDDLRYYDHLLGHWEIRYPNADGMANMNYAESLELRPDGTFFWAPCPLWAKPGGRWGVIGSAETGQLKLYFEKRQGGSFRGEWLVVTPLKFGGKVELLLHWQRTVSDAVVFADRILIARLISQNTSVTVASYGWDGKDGEGGNLYVISNGERWTMATILVAFFLVAALL